MRALFSHTSARQWALYRMLAVNFTGNIVTCGVKRSNMMLLLNADLISCKVFSPTEFNPFIYCANIRLGNAIAADIRARQKMRCTRSRNTSLSHDSYIHKSSTRLCAMRGFVQLVLSRRSRIWVGSGHETSLPCNGSQVRMHITYT